jgi:hypothetical protein
MITPSGAAALCYRSSCAIRAGVRGQHQRAEQIAGSGMRYHIRQDEKGRPMSDHPRFHDHTRALQIVVMLGVAVAVQAADGTDACSSAMPDTLAAAAAKQFPAYRAPLVADNAPDDVAFSLKRGHSGCLGVASADLDGDGVADYVLALTPLAESRPLVVIALARSAQWVFHVIESEVGTRARLYVDVVPPGRYDRDESLGPPPTPDEQRQLSCAWSGAVVGATHASAIVYCLGRGNWRRVVVAD